MTDKEIENLSMEEAMDSLDALLNDMESGEHTLEETFALYTQGVKLVKSCSIKIDGIEKKLQILESQEETGHDN